MVWYIIVINDIYNNLGENVLKGIYKLTDLTVFELALQNKMTFINFILRNQISLNLLSKEF